jgi:16S rRNA (adenine1518-N6/adenine1519-N6)-dimethyltransferase
VVAVLVSNRIAGLRQHFRHAIIEKFLSCTFQPEMMVLMVQKEVADRIVAKDKKTGGPGKESILSIAVKAYGKPTYIGTVKAGNFVPAPSVDSAIIKIADISRNNFTGKHHEGVFFQVVKTGFAHKRKTLSGNLKNVWEPEIIDEALVKSSIHPTARAEDLGISDWLTLARVVYTMQYAVE